ncbi:MAG TPA: phosphatidylglycerophosphatase A [Rhizomicrobium sp.]|jgi:phosphatidylglycerophosphatase A
MNAAALLSTFFGVGRSPVAPGTAASIVALPLAWLIQRYAGATTLAAASVVGFGIGVWSTGLYARTTGKDDPSECVIDEVAGQWLACAFAPLTLPGYAAAFVLFRLFDITKLWPVSWGEKQSGGMGIMLDDMIAGAMAGIIVALLKNAGII